MKSKQSRSIGITVGLALTVLAVFLTFNSEDKEEIKPQTKVEQVKKEVRVVAQAKVRQRTTPGPVEVTLGDFKSSWDKNQ